MPRLAKQDPSTLTGQGADLITGIQQKLGKVPNVFQHMVSSPAVLNAYLQMSGALAEGSLQPRMREQIALQVAEMNRCNYCLAAHTAIGKGAGLNDDEMLAARKGESTDPKTEAMLRFVRQMVANRGNVSDDEVQSLKTVGFNDGEIGEMVANIALNLFTNYFNHVADPEVDFPKVELMTSTAV